MNTIMEVRHLTKCFAKQKPVLNNVNLTLEKGSMTALVGASGAGKTTFLNILGLLDHNFSGEFLILGKNVDNFNDKKSANLRNSEIGFILQEPILIPKLSVAQNILLPTLYRPNKKAKNIDYYSRMLNLTKLVGIETLLKRKPYELSGGQKQRVVAVRALINDPDIILADEPTGSLDQENATIIIQLLKEINKKRGKTILTVTHDKEIAMQHNEILLLSNGNINKID